MHLVDKDELLEYEVGDVTFQYQRLVHSTLKQLRYLVAIRGDFDDDLFDKLCAAVSLRGWPGLKYLGGYVPWPLEKPASAMSALDQEALARLARLVPMTRQQLEQLHGALYVVECIPSTSVVRELARLAGEYAPEALEKKWQLLWNGSSSGVIPTVGGSSPVSLADNRSVEVSHATAEA